MTEGERTTAGAAAPEREATGPLFHAIVRTTQQPLLVLDEELLVRLANPAFLQAFKLDPAQVEGQPLYELSGRQWDIPELRRLLERVLSRNETVEHYRLEHDFARLGLRSLSVNADRISMEEQPDRILLAIDDITTQVGYQEFLEKMLDAVREGLLVLDWNLRVERCNLSFRESFQVGDGETTGKLVYELGNGQWDIPELRELLEKILPEKTSFDDFLVRHHFQEVGYREMLLNGRQINHIQRILLAIRDVTEERRSEQARQTLVAELQHRVKNILAIVSALFRQTRKGSNSIDELAEAFEGRLGALSRIQDSLVRLGDGDVELSQLIHSQLDAQGAPEGQGYRIEGPKVVLNSRQAQALSMAAHELATNAAKYGALNHDGGRIEVTWRRESRNGKDWLELRWREDGFSPPDRVPRKGFGREMIEDSLPYMLGGESRLTLGEDGVDCIIRFPLKSAASEGGRPPR